jgi:hypothetical protein
VLLQLAAQLLEVRTAALQYFLDPRNIEQREEQSIDAQQLMPRAIGLAERLVEAGFKLA